MIRLRRISGFKVYYGDGTTLDVLRASGATELDDPGCASISPGSRIASSRWSNPISTPKCSRAPSIAATRAAGEGRRRLSATRFLARSSLTFGAAVLRGLRFDDIEIARIEDVRDRDAERFELQLAGGIEAARADAGQYANAAADAVHGAAPRSKAQRGKRPRSSARRKRRLEACSVASRGTSPDLLARLGSEVADAGHCRLSVLAGRRVRASG